MISAEAVASAHEATLKAGPGVTGDLDVRQHQRAAEADGRLRQEAASREKNQTRLTPAAKRKNLIQQGRQ